MPWITADHAVRVGAAADFTGSVVLEFRNNAWKLQPQAQVTDLGTGTITFAQTRTAAPEDVGGDLKLGTFNVLNYFNTTGQDYNATHPGACTFFTDRAGNPITVNNCNPTGPRGAARTEDLERQQGKIVTAINAMDADIVVPGGDRELGRARRGDRDDAVSTLVGCAERRRGQHPLGVRALAGRTCPTSLSRTSSAPRSSTTRRPSIWSARPRCSSSSAALRQRPRAAGSGVRGRGRPGRRRVRRHRQPLQVEGLGVRRRRRHGQGTSNPDRIAQANALVRLRRRVQDRAKHRQDLPDR